MTHAFILLLAVPSAAYAQAPYKSPFEYTDPKPRAYSFSERASVIDPRCRSHPEIKFVLEQDGKPRDVETAFVDTRVPPRGKLVLALFGGKELFKITGDLGFHAIRVPYADGWFALFKDGTPKNSWRGDIRLEAATGADHSPLVSIPRPDGLTERSVQFVKWLATRNPEAKWDYYLNSEKSDLKWDDVIIAGISHGSTTAARFAMHRKLDRVLMFSGPRDQDQSWQAGQSATPPERFFGFTHVLDAGWTGKHYCRSWELLGLHKLGPIVDVEKTSAPYAKTRRLITTYPDKSPDHAHSAVAPGASAYKDGQGNFVHTAVWRYLLTHPVDLMGEATDLAGDCQKKGK